MKPTKNCFFPEDCAANFVNVTSAIYPHGAAAARPLVARDVSEAQHVPSASARAAYPSLSSLAMD